jgi:uncharacterized protein
LTSPPALTAARLIELLRLEPLPVEGGHFRQTWRSAAGTAIYYLLTDDPDSFSALHRLPTDEIYHFYLGDPVELLLLHDGGRIEHVALGPALQHGQHVQYVVPHGVWQGSRLRRGGRFALLGTTMAPGFEPSTYESGEREGLAAAYPAAAEAIRGLTRRSRG